MSEFDRLLAEFDFRLPPDRIAQAPTKRRADARLMVWEAGGSYSDRHVDEIDQLLRPDDLLVLNDTRVMPARLFGTKVGGSAAVEILLLRPVSGAEWEVLLKPARRLPVDTRIALEGGGSAEVVADVGDGVRKVRGLDGLDLAAHAIAHGHMPLPPYISRPDDAEDRERYQTVFARELGSAAAPTAGLHLDDSTLQRIRERGVAIAHVTLHVGLGTFRPLVEEDLRRGRLHSEHFSVSKETLAALRKTRATGGRVIAVGTTACRALESVDAEQRQDVTGETELFLKPGDRFQNVDVLMTNFHLPRSSLLMLVAAFTGDRWRVAYARAAEMGYRFYSYGDANWIEVERA